jgi:hypothetical protein
MRAATGRREGRKPYGERDGEDAVIEGCGNFGWLEWRIGRSRRL